MSKHGTLKRGATRIEDDKIFWAYHPSCKNGQQWVTKDAYIKKTESSRKCMAERYKKNPEACKAITNKSHKKHRNAVRACFKRWYYKNREDILNRNRLKRQNEKHKKRVREYQNNRKKTDYLYRLRSVISTAICNCIKKKGFRKKSKTADILGCSFEQFKDHLASQFKLGMSWDNRHLWHIDHIMPVSMAKTYDELVRLNHYKNLRPMWAEENLRKSDKTPDVLVLF